MSNDELACTYAALILHDEGLEVTAEKISTLTNAANVEVEAFYPTLFASFLSAKPLGGLLSNVGGGGAAPVEADAPAAGGGDAPAETKKAAAPAEESEDGDMGFGLFD
eukprot:TRINITY_DN624_c5_g2_i1.p1 TRINITY_DN624_c5_g2~~TRINITY_DN624_c5_g2_i1.p1  ORF type:complete len:127 (+),score=41.97 TRINITY_DN624_c5_g2_i1:59-382(+)